MLSLFTGARKGNLTAMRWEDVDLEEGKWMIAAEHSKNHETMSIVLSPPALEILVRRQENRSDSPWVFPSPRIPGEHIRDPQRAWELIDRVAAMLPCKVSKGSGPIAMATLEADK